MVLITSYLLPIVPEKGYFDKEEKEEKMTRVEPDEWVKITLSMQGKHVYMLDQLREDLSRSAYVRQLIKKERAYR